MFDALAQRLDKISSSLKNRGRISERDLDEALAEIRAALLDADVELSVVGGFLDGVRARCEIEALSKSLTPGQQVVKAVNDELVRVLGGEPLKVTYASRPPTVVLLAGLQGAGKTTAAAKLATWFKSQGRSPLLVAADLQRPAAVEQLRVLGGQAGVPVFSQATDPVDVAVAGVAEAVRVGRDVCIIDTAGRLSIDDALMAEVRTISSRTSPHYTFLVIDAMTGQDAVQTARRFHDVAGSRRRHRDEARRRRAGRRRAVGAHGRRQADRVRVGRGAVGGPRPLLPRPDGEPDPRHGRRADAHRAGRAHDGRRRRPVDGRADDGREVHPRRLLGPAPRSARWARSAG